MSRKAVLPANPRGGEEVSEDHPIAADSYIAELTDERDRLLQRLERVKEALQAARLYVNQLSDQRPTSGRVAAQRKFVEAREFVAAMYEVIEEEKVSE